MKKLLTTLTLVAACAGSLAAREGFYTQIELGGAQIHGAPSNDNLGNLGLSRETGSKKLSFATALAAGYEFEVSESFSFGPEIGYKYVGKQKMRLGRESERAEMTRKLHIFDILAVGTYHVTESFDVFGKAGFAIVNSKNDYKEVGVNVPVTNKSYTKVRPELAAGAGYMITEDVQLIATVSHIFGKKPAIRDTATSVEFSKNAPSVTMLTAGVKFLF